MGSFSFADDFGVSRSRLVDPKLNLLAVSHRSGDNFAAKRVARVQIPPSPRGRGVLKTLQTETALGLFD